MFPLLPPLSLFLNILGGKKKKVQLTAEENLLNPFRKKIAIKQRESMTFFSLLGEVTRM